MGYTDIARARWWSATRASDATASTMAPLRPCTLTSSFGTANPMIC